jgi:lysophospholipase L1-like esterase
MKDLCTRTAQATLCATAVLLSGIDTTHAQTATPFAVTYGAAQVQEGLIDPGLTLTNQTLRQIVHTSIAGSVARLRLSNIYGNAPVTISDVHIALSANNQAPQTVAGSDVAVTFGGATSVTIPAGQIVTSDNVNFNVPALGDVAISYFFPSTVPTNLTVQDFYEQNSFFINGDMSGGENFTPLGTAQRTFFLYGLDVQQPSGAGTLVAFGASITHGEHSNVSANHRWPNVVASHAIAAGFNLAFDNQGLDGGGSQGDPGMFGPGATERFSTDVLDQPGVKWIVYSDFPINDEDGAPGGTVPLADEESFLESAISQAHAKGIKVICSTLTPAGGPNNSQWTPAAQTILDGYNTFVKSSSSSCDAVFDQFAVMLDPNTPDTPNASPMPQINPPFSNFDGIHPNDVGYQVLANAFNLSILGTVPANTPLIPNGTYVIVVRNSGEGNTPLVVDDTAASTASGTAQEIWTLNGGANQHWQLTNIQPNVVSLINQASGLALEVAGGSTANGATVDQAPFTGATSQEWQVSSAGNGWFKLLNVKSGQSLDVTGGSTTPGTPLIQFPFQSGPNQQWSFVVE